MPFPCRGPESVLNIGEQDYSLGMGVGPAVEPRLGFGDEVSKKLKILLELCSKFVVIFGICIVKNKNIGAKQCQHFYWGRLPRLAWWD